jgi:hypothetical protein
MNFNAFRLKSVNFELWMEQPMMPPKAKSELLARFFVLVT